ncbi:hypothetical protein ACX80E_12570 [Arthrobacter sp. TMN-49]
MNQPQGSVYAPPSSMPPVGPGFPPPVPPAPTAPAANKNAGKGLAITALCLALVSLVLCWVPIVNNLVFFLGLLALGFAIPALVISVKKRSTVRGMSIAATVIAVVSLVGVFATQALYSSMIEGIGKSIEEGSDGVVDVAPKDQKKADAGALALGATGKVGADYEVTVKGVNLNAGAVIAAVGEYNEPAKDQYVLVDIAVKYIGAEEGDPWIDLGLKLVGSDARQYSAATCGAMVEKPGTSVPTLENGGTGEYQVCMDVPASALASAKVFVEPTFSMNDNERVYWTTK